MARSSRTIHFQVLAILFVAALLIFFSSFVSLNQHDEASALSTAESSREALLDLSRKEPLTTKTEKTHDIAHDASPVNANPKGEEKRENLREKKRSQPQREKEREAKTKTELRTVARNVLDAHREPLSAPVRISTRTRRWPRDDPTRCRVSLSAKCVISRWVHYWDDRPDCFVSPLRALHGLQVPLEQRKFVVFQPDLGGWNNIRMALEVVILFAKATGRVLVLPPPAILYLLNLKKKWGENRSGMEDYFDIARLTAFDGLETMPMRDFLSLVAREGLLKLPLPENNEDLAKQPLWKYLEQACFVRQWSPGQIFIGLNTPADRECPTPTQPQSQTQSLSDTHSERERLCLGDFNHTQSWRIQKFKLEKRSLLPYDEDLHAHRAIYFPGHEQNRLLTHFYSFLFFATEAQDHAAKRFIRDRLRYHDEIFCVGSRIIDRLVALQEQSTVESMDRDELRAIEPQYVAFHIRRGDFQQKHTRLPAEQIVALTNDLVPDRASRIAYIATDEKNRSFFAPFLQEYRAVYFLDDVEQDSGIENVSANYVGMIEQVICAAAHTFIGTPLSTFTAYITRMRGYLNRTIEITDGEPADRPFHLDRRGIYERTFYFMKHHMHMLHTKPHTSFPLWVRDFVDVFQDIDDDLDYREFGEL